MGTSLPLNSMEPKVFVSYSRKDLDFAARLVDDLISRGFDAYLDKNDILPGEPWRERLGALIAAADNIVFLISPDSIRSEYCDWESDEAVRLNKRILPVVHRPVPDTEVPGRLRRLNYIFMRSSDDYAAALDILASALTVDIDWVREHTRLNELAALWADPVKGGDHALLRGAAISAAERWLSSPPAEAMAPTELHREFIQSSRASQNAQERRAIRRSRLIAVTALVAAVIMGVLTEQMFLQWQDALRGQSKTLAEKANQLTKDLDPTTAVLLALEAQRDSSSERFSQRLRPYVPEAEFALRHALSRGGRLQTAVIEDGTRFGPVVWSRDGAILYVAVGHSPFGSQRIVAKDLQGKQLFEFEGEHAGAINLIELSPDQSQVLSASEDRTARLWDAHTGKEIHRFIGHEGGVRTAAFSGDGTRVVTASRDGSARVWDTASGNQLLVLPGHNGELNKVAISYDRSRILTATLKTAYLWDGATGRQLKQFPTRSDDFPIAAMLPDARHILTADQNNDIVLWDAESGNEVKHYVGHKTRITDLTVSQDGARIVSSSQERTTILWDADGGEEFRWDGAGQLSRFSADEHLVITWMGSETAHIWDAVHGEAVAKLAGHSGWVNFARVSPDGSHALTCDEESLRIWSTQGTRELHRFVGRKGEITSAALSPNKLRLIITYGGRIGVGLVRMGAFQGYATEPKATIASIWDVGTGTLLHSLEGHSDEVLSAKFSPDGERVATASGDRTAILWDVETGKQLHVLEGHGSPVIDVAFSPDGGYLATASLDGAARLWDPNTGALIKVLDGRHGGLSSVKFSPNSKVLLTVSNDATAQLWSVDSDTPKLVLVGHEQGIVQGTFAPDGKRIVTASGDQTARVWDTFSGRTIHVLRGHTGWLTSVAFSGDGTRVITTSEDMTARVWDADDGHAITILKGHTNEIAVGALNDNGSRALTGSDDRTARLWDVQSGAELSRLEGHKGKLVASLLFRDRAVTASADGAARLWDLTGGQALLDAAKSTISHCLSEAERKQFNLEEKLPRWCFEMKKLPFENASPPAQSLSEVLLRTWDAVTKALAG